MENLIKKSDYAKLYSDVISLVDKSISPSYLNNIKTNMGDLYDYLRDCVAEYLHEQVNGWNSYSSNSAKELKSYISKCTKISLKISDCEKIVKYIYDFCQNYYISADLFFINDGSNRRCYNGESIDKDAFDEFKKYINYDALIDCQKNNVRYLIMKYVDDYMTRNAYSTDKVNDLMNLIVEFVGIDISVENMKIWLNWLETHTNENVNITLNNTIDGFFNNPEEQI